MLLFKGTDEALLRRVTEATLAAARSLPREVQVALDARWDFDAGEPTAHRSGRLVDVPELAERIVVAAREQGSGLPIDVELPIRELAPDATSARWAGMSEAITGVPQASASTTGRSKPSSSEGASSQRAAA